MATETKKYKANDLSGLGAAASPGRWNEEGQTVVYAAGTLALAVLETAAHIDDGGLPLNRFVVAITVPMGVWRKRMRLTVEDLDAAWSAIPAGKASVDAGSAWYTSGSSALLLVPSVIVPEEFVVLINASHGDAKGIDATTKRPLEFNKLFR